MLVSIQAANCFGLHKRVEKLKSGSFRSHGILGGQKEYLTGIVLAHGALYYFSRAVSTSSSTADFF